MLQNNDTKFKQRIFQFNRKLSYNEFILLFFFRKCIKVTSNQQWEFLLEQCKKSWRSNLHEKVLTKILDFLWEKNITILKAILKWKRSYKPKKMESLKNLVEANFSDANHHQTTITTAQEIQNEIKILFEFVVSGED